MATNLPKKQPGKQQGPEGNPIRDLHKLMEKQQFGSMEEMVAFTQKISQAPIPAFKAENEKEEAEELAIEALELNGEAQKELLLEALDLDPDCILAYHVLGAAEISPAIALAFYERGTAIGRIASRAWNTQGEQGAFLAHP